MKTFIIINGTKLRVTEQKHIGYARQVAVALSDHSKEIAVHEVTATTNSDLKVLENIAGENFSPEERLPPCWNV